MTERTAEVSGEAEQTGRHAAEVREHAAELNAAIDELRHSVIRVVRTSTDEVDRRRSVRHSVDLPCTLTFAGQDPRMARNSGHLGAGCRGARRVNAVPWSSRDIAARRCCASRCPVPSSTARTIYCA